MGSCLFAVGALLAGCSSKRIEECNALIGVINGEQENARAPATQEPKDLLELADRLDEVAKKVAAVTLTQEKLQSLQLDYQALVGDIGAVMREAAAALRDQDRKKLDAARARETELGEREDLLVTAINQFCTGS